MPVLSCLELERLTFSRQVSAKWFESVQSEFSGDLWPADDLVMKLQLNMSNNLKVDNDGLTIDQIYLFHEINCSLFQFY